MKDTMRIIEVGMDQWLLEKKVERLQLLCDTFATGIIRELK